MNKQDFFTKYLPSLLSIISSIISILLAIKVFMGQLGEVGWWVLIVSLSCLWLTCLYFGFGHHLKDPPKSPYPRLKTPAVICVFAILLMVIAAWSGPQFYQYFWPNNKVVILVADFDEPKNEPYLLTQEILEQLRDAASKYKDIEIRELKYRITAKDGSAAAREKAKEQKGDILLWGYYGVTQDKVHVIVHYEVLPSKKFSGRTEPTQRLTKDVKEITGFTLQADLSHEMRCYVLLTMALARYEAEDFKGAIERFDEALQHKAIPEIMLNPEIYLYVGNAFKKNNNFVQAMDYYNQAIELNREYAPAYNNRGDIYLDEKDYDRAFADFDKAIKLDNKLSEAYNNRGVIYSIHKKDYVQALNDYNEAITLNPNIAMTFNNRGIVYIDKKDYDKAIRDFNQAIKLDPRFALPFNNRGNVYADKKDYEKAIHDYTKAIKLDPKLAIAYNNRGSAYADKKDYKQAISDYSQAIALDPKYSSAYKHRGKVYENKKDYENAIADYNKAIELEPKSAETYDNRGSFFADKKDYDHAISDYTKAIEIDPKLVLAYTNRGTAHLHKKEYDEGIADYKIAIDLDPKSAESYNGLAACYNSRMDYDIAIFNVNKAINLESKSADLYRYYVNRGKVYYNKGEYDTAIADYDMAIRLDPKMPEAYQRRGHAFYAQHYTKRDVNRAKADWAKAEQLRKESGISEITE